MELSTRVHSEFVVLRKVHRHFPLIPWLWRMYNTLVQAELMTWHAQNKSIDGMVRHATKSQQWKFVDEKWLEFAMEPINV